MINKNVNLLVVWKAVKTANFLIIKFSAPFVIMVISYGLKKKSALNGKFFLLRFINLNNEKSPYYNLNQIQS
jgi:hypothetical protein